MDGLAQELRRLRARRGLDTDRLADQLGPVLRRLVGLTGGETDTEARGLVTAALRRLPRELPDDLRLAFLAGMGVHPDARGPVLEQRLEWVAHELHVSPRTARRRLDQAIDRVADLPEPGVGSERLAPPDWKLAALRTRLSLGAGTASAVEEREIVAAVDGLDEITVSARVPRHGTGPGSPHGVDLVPLHGAESVSVQRVTDTYFRHRVRFGSPLDAGQRHVFALRVGVPAGQPLRPRYVFRPLRHCGRFRLDLSFARDRPDRVWTVPGVPNGAVEDLTGDPLAPAGPGAYRIEFTALRPGFAYGLGWD
ncbi:hypothetical protein [Nocardiopsis sp. CNT312]|uniref:hypothetical protein n=1 Tax=Nocardiopsis sp. CNT312 TaxID=1137268 RepID=UPI0004B1413B|nr:hypothetical protein [Nocardiopsis sp. CNT312]